MSLDAFCTVHVGAFFASGAEKKKKMGLRECGDLMSGCGSKVWGERGVSAAGDSCPLTLIRPRQQHRLL